MWIPSIIQNFSYLIIIYYLYIQVCKDLYPDLLMTMKEKCLTLFPLLSERIPSVRSSPQKYLLGIGINQEISMIFFISIF